MGHNLTIGLLLVLMLLGVAPKNDLAQTSVIATTTLLDMTTAGVAGRRAVKLVGTVAANKIPVTGGQVVFAINGKDLPPVQVVGAKPSPGHSTGVAWRSLLLPSGKYSVTARYLGTNAWASSSSQQWTLTIPPLGAATLTIARTGGLISYDLRARDNLSRVSGRLSLESLATSTSLADMTTPDVLPALKVRNSDLYLAFAPSAMAITDLSGQGTEDIALTSYTQGTLAIFLQQPDGTWSNKFQTISVGSGPTGIVAMDLDGDGLTDLAVVSSGSDNITILLQDSAHPGTFLPASDVAVGSTPVAIATGDFNADGLPDLAVANFGDNTVSILLNNQSAPGHFISGPVIAAQSGPSAIALGDFTGSGHLDMAVTSYFDATLSIFTGSPLSPGLFVPPANVDAVGAGPTAIVASDLNGDGLTDLVVCNSLDGTLSILPANPSMAGQFPQQFIIDGFNQPASVATMEGLSASRMPDLLVPDDGTGALTILHNNGKGLFTTRSVLSIGSGLSSVTPMFWDVTGSFQIATLDPGLQEVHVSTNSWSETGTFRTTLIDSSLQGVEASFAPDQQPSDQLASNVLTFSGLPQEAQTIDFGPLKPVKYGAGPVTLEAKSSSGLSVAFSVRKGPALLTSGNTLKVTGVGTVVVRASQQGNADFSDALPVDRVFYVSPADLVLTANPAERAQGRMNPVFTGSISGLIGTDDVKVRFLSGATPKTPAGVYSATPLGISPQVQWTAALHNYTVHPSVGTLTVCRTVAGAHTLKSGTTTKVDAAPGAPLCAPGTEEPAKPIAPTVPAPSPSGGSTTSSSPLPLPLPTPKRTPKTPVLIPVEPPVTGPVSGPVTGPIPEPEPMPVRVPLSPVPIPTDPISVPVPVPAPPRTPPLPSLPSFSLGLPSVLLGVPSLRTNDTSSLVLLEDRRVPLLFGGVTLSITLSCPRGAHPASTVLLAHRSAIIASLHVRPGEEFRVRVPLDDDGPTSLTAYYSGDAKCPSSISHPLELKLITRTVIPLQDSPVIGLIRPVQSDPLPFAPWLGEPTDDTPQTDPTKDSSSMNFGPDAQASFAESNMFDTQDNVPRPEGCMKKPPRLPIQKACSSSTLPTISLDALLSSFSPRCASSYW